METLHLQILYLKLNQFCSAGRQLRVQGHKASDQYWGGKSLSEWGKYRKEDPESVCNFPLSSPPALKLHCTVSLEEIQQKIAARSQKIWDFSSN